MLTLHFPCGFMNRCVCTSVTCPNSLLDSQKTEQRLVGLFVEPEDPLPVLDVLLLLLQAVQGEERRVESREQQREEQSGATHHHTAGGEERNSFYFNIIAMDELTRILLAESWLSRLVTTQWICSERLTFLYIYLCVCVLMLTFALLC